MADGSNFDGINAARGWSPERLAKVKELWMERGWSGAQIAKELGQGATRSAIIGLCFRRGWKRSEAAALRARPDAFIWTADLDNRLRRAVAAGDTDARIAADLGAPLRSVTHRRDRLGLIKRGIRRNPTLVYSRPGSTATHGIERAPTPVIPEGFAGMRTTLTIRAFECRWPMAGEGAETTLCGHKAADGPYCRQHASVARNPVQPKGVKNDLVRLAKRYA